MSDQELIQGYLKGQQKAYATISSWIQEVLRSASWHERLSNDDIASDTHLKLILNLRRGSFEQRSSFKTYVQRIARYTIIDAVRRWEVTKVDPLGDDAEVPANEGDSGEMSLHVCIKVLQNINPRCRELWTLIIRRGLKYAKVGELLKTSEGNIKVRVNRCKAEAMRIVARLR